MIVNRRIRQDPQKLEEYIRRLKAVATFLDFLGYGTRSRVAYEVGMTPTSITAILNQRRISAGVLETIKEWAVLHGLREFEAATNEGEAPTSLEGPYGPYHHS